MLTNVKEFVVFVGAENMEPVEVKSRDLAGLSIPPESRAFFFYSVIEGTLKHNGKDVKMLSSGLVDKSPLHIIGGKILTKAEVLTMLGEGDRKEVLRTIHECPSDKFVTIGQKFTRSNGSLEISMIVPFNPAEHVLVTLQPKVA